MITGEQVGMLKIIFHFEPGNSGHSIALGSKASEDRATLAKRFSSQEGRRQHMSISARRFNYPTKWPRPIAYRGHWDGPKSCVFKKLLLAERNMPMKHCFRVLGGGSFGTIIAKYYRGERFIALNFWSRSDTLVEEVNRNP